MEVMARPEGLEPPTLGSEDRSTGCCSIPLSTGLERLVRQYLSLPYLTCCIVLRRVAEYVSNLLANASHTFRSLPYPCPQAILSPEAGLCGVGGT